MCHKMPSKGQIGIWTDNDLKHIDPREPHKIQILSRVMDDINCLKQKSEEVTGPN